MSETVYDQNAQHYLAFVDAVLSRPGNPFSTMADTIGRLIGERLDGASVCDVACGEGYVSRLLASAGAGDVVGIDISSALVEEARRRTDLPNVTFRVDDAQRLTTIANASVDVAVSQMAMMDIPDHAAAFRAVRRVVVDGGSFVFSMLHPCFEAPFREPDEPHFILDAETPVAVAVRRYATEGHWDSGGSGVRGHVGSYHRTVSTYVNDLQASGFRLERMEEVVVPGAGLFAEVPRFMLIAGAAE